MLWLMLRTNWANILQLVKHPADIPALLLPMAMALVLMLVLIESFFAPSLPPSPEWFSCSAIHKVCSFCYHFGTSFMHSSSQKSITYIMTKQTNTFHTEKNAEEKKATRWVEEQNRKEVNFAWCVISSQKHLTANAFNIQTADEKLASCWKMLYQWDSEASEEGWKYKVDKIFTLQPLQSTEMRSFTIKMMAL